MCIILIKYFSNALAPQMPEDVPIPEKKIIIYSYTLQRNAREHVYVLHVHVYKRISTGVHTRIMGVVLMYIYTAGIFSPRGKRSGKRERT